MLKCGNYTLERPVGWGRTATYYTAFGGEVAGDSRLVVRYSRSAERRHVQSFLKSAAEQQTAVSNGCRRVAPVLDFGIAETGHAYRVNLGSEISLAELIQAGNTVDHDFLRTIITGTLRGLTELRDKFKRPHGNLSAGNILLDRNGEVLLTDLSPSALEGRHSDDLRNLGAVIYQVVRHSLKIGFLSPPLERSPEWTTALGEHADDWRELTNRLLLTKTGEGAASLERAVKELKALATLGDHATVVPTARDTGLSSSIHREGPAGPLTEARPKKKRQRVLTIAGVLVALAVVAMLIWWLYPKPPPIVDPRLTVEELRSAIPQDFQDGDLRTLTPSGLWQYIAFNWSVPGDLSTMQKTWSEPPREWKKLAAMIQAPVALQGNSTAPNNLEEDRLLQRALREMTTTVALLNSATEVEKQWKIVEKLSEVLAVGCKRVGLPDFSEWARYEVSQQSTLEQATSRIADIRKSLDGLEDFLRLKGSRVHSERMKQVAPSIPHFTDAAFAKPNQLWPQRWLDEANNLLRPEFETIRKWESDFKHLAKRIAGRPPDEQLRFAPILAKLQGDSAEVLVTGAGDISRRIADLRKEIKDPLDDLNTEFWAAVTELKEGVYSSGDDSPTPQVRVTSFIETVNGLLTRPEYAPVSRAYFSQINLDLVSLFDSLRKAAANKGLSKPVFALPPAWKEMPATDGSGATIVSNGSHTITFFIVQDKFAMSTTEISFSLAKELAKLVQGGLERPLAGPLAYRDGVPGNPRADDLMKWLWEKAAAAVPLWPTLRQAVPVHREIGNCPLTWVSGKKATDIAATLGARLPTANEWRMTLESNIQARARLRGEAFKKAQAEMDLFEGENPGKGVVFDEGTFPFRTARTAAERFQGKVFDGLYPWFVPVGSNDPTFGRFSHLIGNAAEWIQSGGSYFVAGGSCMTAPEAAVLVPAQSVGLPDRFSDVSFRFVVDVVPGNPHAARDAIREEVDKLAAKAPSR